MDLQMNLFFLEDCFKSSNGYSYVHNSLNSLLEHKTFSLKARNEIQSVITFINTKLNSHGHRAQGLHLLKVFLPQCSDDIFIDNCVSWMQQCVRICSASREKEIVLLVYEVLGSLIQYSGMIQELTKPVSGSVIPKFLEHVHHVSSNFESQIENAAYLLRCLELVMRNYGGSCGPHKNNIEKFLMKFVDHPDKQTINLAARCVAVLPLVGGGGVMNVNHKNAWEVLQKKLVLYLQETLDALFEGVPEVQLFQSSERTATEKLPTPVLEENDPFLRIQRLTMRFINLSFFLQELLVHELPIAKRVIPQLFINLFVRAFSVNSNTVTKHVTADKLIVGCLIPQMHIAVFKLLGALIICCGQNLLEYGSLICRFVLTTLRWTSYDKHWPHGAERPYGQLRKEAYNMLTLWLKVAKAGSCVEISSPDELIDLLFGDVKISHTAVTLSVAKARGRHLTKQQRKQLKLGQDISASSSESSWSRTKLYDETANHETCAAALRTLQWIIQTAGPFLKPTLHKMIQEELLKILLKIGRGETFAPYGDWKCRLELYQLLHALVLWPHCSWPPPLQFAFQLMRIGLSDPCVKVASFCSWSLNNIVKLVHPVSRPLHFPPSIDDMQEVIQLENSHKNKIFFSESVDTDKSQIFPQEANGLLQPTSSPKHKPNASENHLHEQDTNNLQNSTEHVILETKTVCDINLCASDNSSVHSSGVTTCQGKPLNGDGSDDDAMDFETSNNTSYQEPPNIVTAKKNCDKNGSELEKQNNHNIVLHPELLGTENELEDETVKTVEDSSDSSLDSVGKNETKEKDETVESNSLPEKHVVTAAESDDEEKEEEEEEEKEKGGEDDEEKRGEDEEEKENDGDENEPEDKTDDDYEMENAFLVQAKKSSGKMHTDLKLSDKTVEKPVVRKVPIPSNNYSISYLYDQSSDSDSDGDIKTSVATTFLPMESNEVDQEKLKEVNSLAGPQTDEDSQTCMKDENKIVCDEIELISAPKKLISDICEDKQDGKNILDSTTNSNIADDDSSSKVLPLDLCQAAESEGSEVDVTTIPDIAEKTEKEVAEHTDKMKLLGVLNEGIVTHKDISGEIQIDDDIKNEETSLMEIEKVKEATKLPEETTIPTEVICDSNGNSVPQVQNDQCINGQVEDVFVAHSNNKKTELVNKSDTTEHTKDIQLERLCKTVSSVEIPEKELRLLDENEGTANEQIKQKKTSVSPNRQESVSQIDCHTPKKEVVNEYKDSVSENVSSEAGKGDAENLTEPLTKKRKLETSVPETENNCQEQPKENVV